jgi:two-component system, NarL family, sensor histidine kinase UhpB
MVEAFTAQPAKSGSAIRILHLEDSTLDHQLVERSLRQSGLQFEMQRLDTLRGFEEKLEAPEFDVILADYHLAGFTAIDAWKIACNKAPAVPFVLLSGAIGEAAAVEAIKLGMSDYLLKDNLGKLPHVMVRAIELAQTRQAKARADAELAASERRLADFAEHLQTTIEQERASIAREIHDDIGGSLAAIKFDLAWIGRHSSDEILKTHVEAANGMLQHAIGASQRIMMNLRPAVLDQGLVAALEWLCAGFEKRTSITTRFTTLLVQAEPQKATQLTAYRTAQEALTNISKYAQCSLVTVDLNDAGGVLTLEINDNGCGISAGQLDKPKSYGLRGLRERAKTVGGWLDVSSRNGGEGGAGTSIILSVPIAVPVPDPTNESFQ